MKLVPKGTEKKQRHLSVSLLKEIQELDYNFNKTKLEIGTLETQKLDLYEAMKVMRKKFQDFERKIARKYGKDSIVNMETGIVTKKEDAKN